MSMKIVNKPVVHNIRDWKSCDIIQKSSVTDGYINILTVLLVEVQYPYPVIVVL